MNREAQLAAIAQLL